MYKKLILLVILLSFSSVLVFGQETSAEKQSKYIKLLTGKGNETVDFKRKNLTKSANNYLKAIKKKDAKIIFSYMNPVFVKNLGGKEKALDFIEKELKDINESKTIASIELVKETLERKHEEPFNRLAIKIKTEKSETDGFLIPIPNVEKPKYQMYFLHAEGILTSLTPSNCGMNYKTILPRPKSVVTNEPKSGSGSGTGSGRGSGSGSGTGSGRGSGDGVGIGNGDGSKIKKQPPPPKPATKTTGITSGIKILTKPRPKYSFISKINNIQGVVRVRVIFIKSGKIGSVSVVKGLPCGLTQNAIDAARQIKFTPPMRNGTPYSIAKVVQFNFNLYDQNNFEDYLK